MNEPPEVLALLHKRRLRLGALLFQLHYYMIQPETASQPAIFQHVSDGRVEALGDIVWLYATLDTTTPDPQNGERLSLADAILRCRQAVAGQPLHHQTASYQSHDEPTGSETGTV